MYAATVTAYRAPGDLAEALALLTEHGDRARVLAGGQSSLQRLRSRSDRPETLVDLRHLGALRRISTVDGQTGIGALVRYRDLASDAAVARHWPALVDAVRHIGDRQVRNRGTLGGNLSFADVTGDLAPVCAALSARIVLSSSAGERELAVEEFIVGPNRTAARADELLTRVLIPKPDRAEASAYEKYGVTFNGRAVIGVAANVALGPAGRVRLCRVVVGGVPPKPARAAGVEPLLLGTHPGDEILAEAANIAADEVAVHDDLRASADYRRQLVRIYTERVLETAIRRAEERLA